MWQTKEKHICFPTNLASNLIKNIYKEKPDILSDNHQLEHDGGMMTLDSTIQ